MNKRNRIIYWIATLWLSLGMLSTGIVQLMQVKEQTQFVLDMGFPAYFVTLLGFTKILGVIAILIPRYPLVKEWAYAGFFFTMSGAVYSHIATGHPAKDMFGPILLLVLITTSWYFRPGSRKLVLTKA
ncbi:MAG: DoxX family protein [Chitinophagales bacterium]|nr:DoxX family protein [Chitinophagales bacterium]